MVEIIVTFISIGTFILAINVILSALKEQKHNKIKGDGDGDRSDEYLEIARKQVIEDYKRDNPNVKLEDTYKKTKCLREKVLKRVKELQNKE